MNDTRPVRTTIEGDVVVVTLGRPPVNAVDVPMYRMLRDAFDGLGAAYPDAEVCILEAEGPHFCAGNDLHEFATMDATNAASRMRVVREAFAAIHECPIPVIAAVQGSALGTGVAIAASCDIIVASEDARFGTPEVQVGVLGGARHLARLVPEQVMRRMYFTADAMPAAELARFGGVSEVVPRELLGMHARGLAARIARHGTHALRWAKESLNRTEFLPLRQAYEEEQQLTVRSASHPESMAARRALVGRDRPSGSRAP
ncbi:MAG: enoyl-CoA hydratase/isomerase family protein [Salinibacterium sp.]|nr:enoyl-CoA hydratase-related protein [Salinibacterium sp.]MBF0673376.1 enoyl-CoA hydratase/isomerase family protein [Salinibacterium sp.]